MHAPSTHRSLQRLKVMNGVGDPIPSICARRCRSIEGQNGRPTQGPSRNLICALIRSAYSATLGQADDRTGHKHAENSITAEPRATGLPSVDISDIFGRIVDQLSTEERSVCAHRLGNDSSLLCS